MGSKFISRVFLGLFVLLGVTSNPSIAQSTFVSIPRALQGFYTLEMVEATSLSPIQNTKLDDPADDILLYVTGYGELCTKNQTSGAVQLLASSPTMQGLFLGVVRWDIPASDLSFLLNINQTSFDGFELQSNAGSSYGRLTGNAPVFDDGTCGSPPIKTNLVNAMFDLAEGVYPTLFPSSSFSFNQIGSGYDVFRHYPNTDTYLAVRDDIVYARGGDFGTEFIEVGNLDDLIDDINTMLVPNRIPEFYQGTYLLSLSTTQPFSPISDGTELNFVVTQTGQLCVGELVLSFPIISNNTAIWNNPNGNLRYTVDLTRDDDPTTLEANIATGEFSFQTAGGTNYGLFTGDKTSLSTECSDAKGVSADLANINSMFGLIEQKYPTLFPSGPQTYNQKADGFTYRYYFDSQVLVAVKDGDVYLEGGEFGNNDDVVPYDTLSNVLAQLNNVPLSIEVPASSAGTYAMSFSSATTFSPFADGTAAQVVLDSAGSLCVDGVSLGLAFPRQSSPNIAFWENANTGLSFSLDITTLTATDMSLSVSSSSGLAFSTLSGTRTSLVTGCGSSASVTDIVAANQLFALAEQYYSSLFPASVLTFNQINGNVVKRYYPSTDLTLSIDGTSVYVQGGSYGTAPVSVGQVSALINQITLDNTPATPIYDLKVQGTGVVVMLNTSINRTVDVKRYAIARPDSADSAALQALVASSLSDILLEIDSANISIITDTATQLVFSAEVTSNTTLLGSTTTRNYSLVYTLNQR